LNVPTRWAWAALPHVELAQVNATKHQRMR